MGIVLCTLLLINTSAGTAIRFGLWMSIGHIVYFSYGFCHSKARVLKRQDSDMNVNEIVPAEVFFISETSKSNLISESIDKPIPVIKF